MDQMRGEQPDAESEPRRDHDKLVDELRLMLDALASRAEEYLGDRDRPTVEDTNAASCGWCPVCAVVSMLCGHRTELSTRLVEQLAGMVVLLRHLLDDESEDPPSAPDSPDPAPEAPESKVQRITIRRVDGHVLRVTEGQGC